MDSCRLGVWISTGIMGFQGSTLAFDLLNCTTMGWLYVRMNGLPTQAQQIDAASPNGRVNPGGPPQPSAGSTASISPPISVAAPRAASIASPTGESGCRGASASPATP